MLQSQQTKRLKNIQSTIKVQNPFFVLKSGSEGVGTFLIGRFLEKSRCVTEMTSGDRGCLHFAVTYKDSSSGIR